MRLSFCFSLSDSLGWARLAALRHSPERELCSHSPEGRRRSDRTRCCSPDQSASMGATTNGQTRRNKCSCGSHIPTPRPWYQPPETLVILSGAERDTKNSYHSASPCFGFGLTRQNTILTGEGGTPGLPPTGCR